MLAAINFVRGAIAKKDLVPILTNFHIYKGRIQGYNGSVCIDHPLERTDLDFTVPAKPFIRAFDICNGEPELKKLKNDRIELSKDGFSCRIPLDNPELFPIAVLPKSGCSGHELSSGFLDKIKLIAPFMSNDASRPWSMSIRIYQGYAYATNNISIVRARILCDDVILSSELVTELLRIWQAPKRISCNEKEIFFEYPNGAWIKGQPPAGEWPALEQLFDFEKEDLQTIPSSLKKAVEKLEHFAENGIIRFTEDGVFAGHEDDASVKGFNLHEIAFHVTPLLAMLQVAESFDLEAAPPKFIGKDIEGRICNVSI